MSKYLTGDKDGIAEFIGRFDVGAAFRRRVIHVSSPFSPSHLANLQPFSNMTAVA